MEKTEIYRQGDVMLKRVEHKIKGKKLNHCILAHGEVTGHKHQVKQNALLLETEQGRFLECSQDTVLEHEEHAPISLQKGFYQVIQQREFDILEGIRAVLD